MPGIPTQLKIVDNSGNIAKVSNTTGNLIIASHDDNMLFEGKRFALVSEFTLTTTGDTKDFLLVTPNSNDIMYIEWEISGDDKFKFYLYETPTITSNGTDVTSSAYNRNRNNSNTPTMTLYDTPTISATGTLILGGYTDKYSTGLSYNKIALKKNTNYLFRIEALKDSAVIIVNGLWYEHSPNS